MSELPDCYRCGEQPCVCKDGITLYQGDAMEVLASMAAESVQCVMTSPPYWGLRDYGVEGQLGLEATPDEYVAKMVEVFRGVRRVLRDDGTVWLNMGDSYSSGDRGTYRSRVSDNKGHQVQDDMPRPSTPNGLKPKDLCGIPWRLAFALQADGWYLRSDIIWSKPNPMPESVTDRPTKAHEYLFLLTKGPRYFYDGDAIRETYDSASFERNRYLKAISTSPGRHQPHNTDQRYRESHIQPLNPAGRNRRTVWTIPTQSYPDAHFATFPTALVEPCILAGTSEKGCCPECGAPWVRVVEKSRRPTRIGKSSKIYVDPEGSPYEQHGGSIVGNRDPKRHCTESTTIGWRPGCECKPMIPCSVGPSEIEALEPYEPIPCTVLDPFAGSATMLQVARSLGRHGIGIELSEEYCKLAVQRIQQPREKPPSVKPLEGQMEMFR